MGDHGGGMNRMVRDYRGGMNCMVRDYRGGMNCMMRDYRGGMNCMVSHGMWSQGNSVVSGVVRMRDRSRDWMVRSRVDSMVSHWVNSMVIHWVTRGDRFGEEGVQEGVSVESIERGSFSTVDRVPGLTSEQVLVKQGSVWTNKSCTVGSVPSILTHSVGLTS